MGFNARTRSCVQTAQPTVLRGSVLTPVSPDTVAYWADGIVAIDPETGRITRVGAYTDWEKEHSDNLDAEYLDYRGKLILPGLIDAHLHLPQLPIRGKVGKTLLDWLERYAYPVENRFADASYATVLSQVFFEQLIANGTTTAVVYSSSHPGSTHIALEAAQTSGMRVLMGKVLMNQHCPDTFIEPLEQAIDHTRQLIETWHTPVPSGLIKYVITPRFALSCSMPLLKACGQLLKEYPTVLLQSHLAETPEEVHEVTQLYDNRWHYTQIYEQAGCLGPRTLMAHGLYMTTQELELLNDTQTRLVHCPTSNFFLKSGFFPLPDYDRYPAIPIALGSDVGGGPDLSMFRVMRAMDQAQLVRRQFVSPTRAFYTATLGGALSLGLQSETGSLNVGKSADMIVLNLEALGAGIEIDLQDIETTLSQLMYLGNQSLVEHVWVQGQHLYRRPDPTQKTVELSTGLFNRQMATALHS